MGWSQWKEETVDDNGVVNNNFVVDNHNVNIPLDIKVLFYVLVAAVLARLLMDIYNTKRRSMKHGIKRTISMYVSKYSSSIHM